jgi:hypothetical protein
MWCYDVSLGEGLQTLQGKKSKCGSSVATLLGMPDLANEGAAILRKILQVLTQRYGVISQTTRI